MMCFGDLARRNRGTGGKQESEERKDYRIANLRSTFDLQINHSINHTNPPLPPLPPPPHQHPTQASPYLSPFPSRFDY